MKKIHGCEHEQKLRRQAIEIGDDENLERHIAECAECRESKANAVWMRKFYERTAPPRNLPAPGFLLFKARLIKKQTAATRAVQPIFWMQIIAAALSVLGGVSVLVKSNAPVFSMMSETFRSLLSTAPLLILGALSAILICSAFAYFLRETKISKNNTEENL